MSARPSIWLFVAVAAAIAMLCFAIGQGKPGAGVPVAILLSVLWTIHAQMRWGKING
ncbi:hypothetical protein V5740_03685 [Croceibacterium sp. TMG7-5b_MA50]|uniref:hypothetical protein n=1 Tax=Croceibacterium sp. TMG7-5b_MA50 TaxID=3121290 RepID=UPI00322196FB